MRLLVETAIKLTRVPVPPTKLLCKPYAVRMFLRILRNFSVLRASTPFVVILTTPSRALFSSVILDFHPQSAYELRKNTDDSVKLEVLEFLACPLWFEITSSLKHECRIAAATSLVSGGNLPSTGLSLRLVHGPDSRQPFLCEPQSCGK